MMIIVKLSSACFARAKASCCLFVHAILLLIVKRQSTWPLRPAVPCPLARCTRTGGTLINDKEIREAFDFLLSDWTMTYCALEYIFKEVMQGTSCMYKSMMIR